MNKVLFLVLTMAVSPVSYAETAKTEKLVDMKYPSDSGRDLVNISSSNSRLYQMERRIDDLERELRYQRDSVRDLERTVRDLRRRTI